MVRGNISIFEDTIKLPKLGYIKTVFHRPLPKDSVIKSVTVRKKASGKYYISILVAYEIEEPKLVPISEDKAIGLDYSSPSFYMDSEGNAANYNRYYRKAEAKLAREQRRLSRKQKGSSNSNKQKEVVARVHMKVANQRLDFLHKQSASIAKKYDIVCVEDINLKNMARSLKLGKSTHDNGFGQFRTFLKYKLEEQGKHYVVIDKWCPSSKMCRHCGHVHKELKLSDREYECPNCKTLIKRDHNAAINIKNEGLRMLMLT